MLAYLIQQVENINFKLAFDFLKSCCLKTNTEEKTSKPKKQQKNKTKQMKEEQKKHTVAFACTPEHTLNFIELIL